MEVISMDYKKIKKNNAIEQSILSSGPDESYRYVTFARNISKFISLPKGSKVLDIGINNGEFNSLVFGHAPTYEHHGIDFNDTGFEKIKKGYNIVLGTAERLPYKDNTFDLVVSFEVLEHLISPLLMLNEVNRILKPGGCFVMSMPNAIGLGSVLMTIWRNLLAIFNRFNYAKKAAEDANNHISEISIWRILANLTLCDFKICKVKTIHVKTHLPLLNRSILYRVTQPVLRTFLPVFGSYCIVSAVKKQE